MHMRSKIGCGKNAVVTGAVIGDADTVNTLIVGAYVVGVVNDGEMR